MSPGVTRGGADPLQLRREHVEQHFRVGGGVQVPAIFTDQHFRELAGVGEVAVVGEHHAVRRVHVERLRFAEAIAPGRGITHVADADVAPQLEHVILGKYVADEALGLARAQLAFHRGRDARRVLAAVLQHRQRVIEALIDRGGSDDSDDAAHDLSPHGLRPGFNEDRAEPRPRTNSGAERRKDGHRRGHEVCFAHSSPTMARRPFATLSP